MTYERWRISFQSSEQAARAAYAESERLRQAIAAIQQQAGHGEAVAGKYFAHDGDNNETFGTLAEAKEAAEKALEYYRDDAPEGWNDNSLNICYGIVLGDVQITMSRDATPDDSCYPNCAGYEERELVAYTAPPRVKVTPQQLNIAASIVYNGAGTSAENMLAALQSLGFGVEVDNG